MHDAVRRAAADPADPGTDEPGRDEPVRDEPGRDDYTPTEQPANLSVIPGKTPMRTYNGTWPGPVIKASSGRPVKLHVINNLGFATTTHLHGAHVTPSSDGGPVDLLPAGQARDYLNPNNQSTRTQWSDDHVKDNTGKNVSSRSGVVPRGGTADLTVFPAQRAD